MRKIELIKLDLCYTKFTLKIKKGGVFLWEIR